jgi:hypothetical protein
VKKEIKPPHWGGKLLKKRCGFSVSFIPQLRGQEMGRQHVYINAFTTRQLYKVQT